MFETKDLLIFFLLFLLGFLYSQYTSIRVQSSAFEIDDQNGTVVDSIIRFVYFGRKSCSACNNSANHKNIKQIKNMLRDYCESTTYKCLMTAVSPGSKAVEEAHYLTRNTGNYDEILAGGSIYNTGYFYFIWNGSMTAGTPQVHISKEKFVRYPKKYGYEDVKRIVDTSYTFKGVSDISDLSSKPGLRSLPFIKLK